MAKPLTRLAIVLPVTEASRIRKAARRQQLAVSRFIRNAVARSLGDQPRPTGTQ